MSKSRIAITILVSILLAVICYIQGISSIYGSRIQDLNKDIKSYKSELEEKDNRIKELEEDNDKWENACRDKDNEIERLDDEVDRLNGVVGEYQNAITIPKHNYFKSYMDYRAISTSSKQGEMLSYATTQSNGLLTLNGDYICVAMGTYYGILGTKYQVTLDNGTVFKVIITDIKADEHTDSTNRYTVSNNCMMEFIVDVNILPNIVKMSGNISTLDGFSGSIVKLERV